MKTSKLFTCLFVLSIFASAAFGQKKRTEIEETKNTKAEVVWKDKGELSTKDITQRRDMTQYDDGGYFDCRDWIAKDASRGVCDEKKIRDYIWQYWMEKKRGYVRVTYDSVDAKSTSHIFIEPDEKGEWSVAWRIVRFHAIPQLNNQITDVAKIVKVERVEDKPEKGEWALVFKNRIGSIMEKIPDFYR
jgi:hypothetical protein